MENTIKRIGVIKTSYEILVESCLQTIAVEVLLTSEIVVVFYICVATSVLNFTSHVCFKLRSS